MKPEMKKISKRWGSEKKVRLSSAPESSRPVPEPKEEDRFHKPAVPLITIGPSLKGKERPYKVILEKEALYEKPQYLA
ncbi:MULTISPECIES: hypothetical protein [Paenibacillus]|jgi:hypothetical protein|uniref:Uncharacterized protein n=2 Tax=Paenibacillus TaxID=44249 RepID=A0A2W0C8T9_9BACL|nr:MULTISPECIES: hypothetical protein [Paenibacillus]MBM6386460.1 hypothetical protein [Paenibacillus sp.]MBE7682647.1 hypothetical protein [Paenibacillus sp. P13VS]MBY0216677.1 hypothetical protein [Paenibacillus illinoisensis]MCG7383543.1 hypothetical protein [Paenibacillus sp. ACRRY]MCM3205784.1 hypothetical protein [Paenibacillus illinoisensis]